MEIYNTLKHKIKNKKTIITVIGLGYVGLPIAIEFYRKGYKVNGLENNVKRISKLKNGHSYINDISSQEILKALRGRKRLNVTKDPKVIKTSDAIIVCVPTPLRKVKEPDMRFIVAAAKTLSKHIARGQIIIFESTTYPGTTRDVILPILEESGLELDKDFYLVFSPERIDPGNRKYGLTNIPKILGGLTKKGTEIGKLLYSQIIKKVIGLASAEAAEVTKLLENTFRIVNIGLINEFATLCHKLDINVWEVIKAASTKPFGFMKFEPGPGIGGHCIPADPMYLSWKARAVGFETKMIDLASKVNRNVPRHIIERIDLILKRKKVKFKSAKIMVVGVTYKKDVNDLRESPAVDIIRMIQRKKARWMYHDSYIPYLKVKGISAKSVKLSRKIIKEQDLIVIVTDHSYIDYKTIVSSGVSVFDTRNVCGKNGIEEDNIIQL